MNMRERERKIDRQIFKVTLNATFVKYIGYF